VFAELNCCICPWELPVELESAGDIGTSVQTSHVKVTTRPNCWTQTDVIPSAPPLFAPLHGGCGAEPRKSAANENATYSPPRSTRAWINCIRMADNHGAVLENSSMTPDFDPTATSA
jgi:hypothetical protein